jgi:hypothetical protein
VKFTEKSATDIPLFTSVTGATEKAHHRAMSANSPGSSRVGSSDRRRDAAGKDGVIKHVMSGVNPQGCEVHSFKAPTNEELDHDYLWRCSKRVPERGRIGIFNRSYYEEVLVVCVHPQILQKQKVPRELLTKRLWDERHEDIRSFERYLGRNGVLVRKFFLHVSKEEQKSAFSNASTSPTKTGSSPPPTRTSVNSGTITRKPTRKPSATPRPKTPRGMSSPRTTNGSPASSSPPR